MEKKKAPNRHILTFSLFTQAIHVPFLLLIAGIALESLSLWSGFSFYMKWHRAIQFARLFGDILISLSGITFLYLITLGIGEKYKSYFLNKCYYTIVHLITIIENGLSVIFCLVALNIGLSYFELQPKYFDFFHNLLYVIIIGAVAWILLQALSLFENMLYRDSLAKGSPNIRSSRSLYTKIHILKNIAAILIILLALAASLMVFDKARDIGISLLASAGFLTAVVALAAQKTLSSFFVGFHLVLTQPLEIGDLVLVEGEFGTVDEVNLSYVIIRTGDNRQIIFPTNYFIDKPFQNWSKDAQVQAAVKFYVDYTFPVEKLREALPDMIKKISTWDGREWSLAVTNANEANIELRIMASVENMMQLDNLRNELREQVIQFVRDNYPQHLPKFWAIPTVLNPKL